MMKISSTKLATSVALIVLAKHVIHGLLFKFWPDYFIKMTAKALYITDATKLSADFAFSWESFIYGAVYCTIMAFVMTWLVIALYDYMVKE